MAYVGDIIMSGREQFTDLPIGTLAVPSVELSVSAAGTGTWPAGNYYVKLTYINPWGESLPSSESSVTLSGTNAIRISGTMIPGATGVRVYVGSSSGQQNNVTNLTSLTIPNGDVASAGTGAIVPTRNTAYLPDTDGGAVSSSALFRWLTEGLKLASRIAGGGIIDATGVGSTVSVGRYSVIGEWTRFETGFYDGYPVKFIRKSDIFRRNVVQGLSGGYDVIYYADHADIEAYPQPQRTSGQTTTTALLSATGTSVTLTASNFVLPFGIVQIDQELCWFQSNSAGTLSGLTRGIGGTTPVVHAIGASVTECNIMLTGYRMPGTYVPGMANQTIQILPGWQEPLRTYLLYRFREAEQKRDEAGSLLSEFSEKMQSMRTNKQYMGPVQIGMRGSGGIEVAASFGSLFGGVVVP